MNNSLRFHPEVATDLKAAASWYDNISIELGNRFRESVNSRFDLIEQRPKEFAKVQEELRACRISGFPYLLIFTYNENETEILGLFHAAANPDKWNRSF